MAPPKKSAKGEIELLPNPWETFERAVDVVAKSPPQHRVAKKKRKAARKTKKAGHKTPWTWTFRFEPQMLRVFKGSFIRRMYHDAGARPRNI
jgi:hypothetical protein